jgi:hypothetical protein
MKNLRAKSVLASISAAVLWHAPAHAADARLTLPNFPGLEKNAAQVMNITLDAPLIALAARFLDDSQPDDAAAKELIAGLTGIYVRSYTFDRDFAYPQADVEGVRRQLAAPGWQRVVEVRSRKEQTHVDVYISMNGNKANGLAIIASQPREFTIVNIVGAIDLQKMHQLEGRLGVPRLELEDKKPSTP